LVEIRDVPEPLRAGLGIYDNNVWNVRWTHTSADRELKSLQSTFKFPLAMAILHQVELGKFQLDQPIRFLKSDRSATYSPLQDEFPEADVDVPLRKLIKLSVETSDNSATDMSFD
jgi:beta-lactamase class A